MHRMSNSNANLKHIIKNYKEEKDNSKDGIVPTNPNQQAGSSSNNIINSNSEVNSQLQHPKQIPQKKHSKKSSAAMQGAGGHQHPPNVPPQLPNPGDSAGNASTKNNKALKQSQETSSTNGFQDYHQVLSASVGGGGAGGQITTTNNHSATQDSRGGANTNLAVNQSAVIDGKLVMKVSELGPGP